MRAIVTGGVGFIGTNLIKRLLNDGHKVVSLDNYSTVTKENEHKDCQYYNVDVSKTVDYSFFMSKPDVIFHLAALARIQPSLDEPSPHIKNNFLGTLNILDYARKNNVQVVYAGSSSFHCGLYGSPYAWSKFGGEEVCRLYSEVYDTNTAVCRFYNVYGPQQIIDGDYAAVIGIFQRQLLDKQKLTVTGDGEQRRDFTHVDDIVEALTLMAGQEFRADVFELGRGRNHSINEVVEMFGGDIEYIPARKGEYDKTLCDYTEAHRVLNWTPKINLEYYVEQWLQENENSNYST